MKKSVTLQPSEVDSILSLPAEEVIETLRAIVLGEADALVVKGSKGPEVYTLKDAHQPYRIMIEKMSEGAAVLDIDGRVLYCNSSFAGLFNTKKSALLGKRIQDMVAPEHKPHVVELVIQSQTAPATAEIDLVGETGLLPVYFSLSPIEIDELPCISLVITDLSDMKRSENLAAKEEFVRRILDQAAEPIIVCDSEGIISHASLIAQWYCTMNPIGRHFDQAFPLRTPSDSNDAAKNNTSDNYDSFHEIEREMLCRDGVTRDFIVNESDLRNAGNVIIGRIITLFDITQRKEIEKKQRQTEADLRQSEARFRAALANSQVTVFEQDLELRYTSIQQPHTGFTADEVIGKRDRDLLIPENAVVLEAMKQSVIDSGIPARQEVSTTRPGEPTAYYDLYVESRRETDGSIIGVICTSIDITRRKEEARNLERTAKILQVSQSTAKVGGWELDLINRTIYWTNEMYRIYEISPDEYIPLFETVLQYYAPESRARLAQAVEEATELGKPFDLELQLNTAKNRLIWVHATSFVTLENGKAIRITGALQDITERKKAEEELMLAAKVYQDSSEAMMVTDENNHIIAVNQAFQEMTGYEPSDVIGMSPSILNSGHHDALFFKKMWEQLHATGRYKGEIWNKKKNGEFFAGQLTVNTIASAYGVPFRYVGLLSDITEKKKSDDVIWTQANFDGLTGLPNRRLFRDHLEQQVRRARRDRTPLALMFLDLDGFKHVNDTLGHDVGDVLLKEAASRLQNCVRDSDSVARLGGDEFTVILTELQDPRNVDRVARHILRTLSEPFHLNGEMAHVSASIGITFYPRDATEIEDLLKNADQAMYAAKQEGKNQYHYFTQEMQDEAIARMHLINDLRNALEGNQFEIVYQPIVALSSGLIQKAEALIRWQHPTRGLVNPVDFISAAEDTGMITSFGNWIFHEAAKQVVRWREKFHPEFQISVNISPVQFQKEGIEPSIWLGHLKNLNLPGQGIVVEITEGLLLDASSKVTDQLLMLRDAGIEVSLDDFGTGYSSLSYLQKFDIDYIKIDQAFVSNLAVGSANLALCEAIIVMAHKLGIKVIAEGVETEMQHELLANGGCDFAQGYLFSRPVPADKFEKLLEADPFSSQHLLKI